MTPRASSYAHKCSGTPLLHRFTFLPAMVNPYKQALALSVPTPTVSLRELIWPRYTAVRVAGRRRGTPGANCLLN